MHLSFIRETAKFWTMISATMLLMGAYWTMQLINKYILEKQELNSFHGNRATISLLHTAWLSLDFLLHFLSLQQCVFTFQSSFLKSWLLFSMEFFMSFILLKMSLFTEMYHTNWKCIFHHFWLKINWIMLNTYLLLTELFIGIVCKTE